MKAFPNMNKDIHPDVTKDLDLNGMDLRDYFAAKAMQGILSGLAIADKHLFMMESIDDNDSSDRSILTENAYSIADAMMEVRNDQR